MRRRKKNPIVIVTFEDGHSECFPVSAVLTRKMALYKVLDVLEERMILKSAKTIRYVEKDEEMQTNQEKKD